MKAVATPWGRLARFILLGFGVPFSLIGVMLYMALDGNWALLFNGALWLIIGAGLWIKEATNQRNLKKLKKEGLCYEGSVVNIIPAHWIRIGSYVIAQVECTYKSGDGDSLVKSGYYVFSPFDRIENMYAKIYFNNNDPTKYRVELFRKEDGVFSA